MKSDRLSVLHFSTSDILGGSARSAYRIHFGLRNRGHRSRVLVGYRMSDDPDIQSVAGIRGLQFLDRLADKIGNYLGYQYYFVPSSFRIAYHTWLAKADVIQLNNTHGGYFALGLLPRLAQKAPLIWRLSDLWAMTGHCAYPGECIGWQSGCDKCPDLEAYPPIGFDRARALFLRKKRIYSKLPITVVAPSSWTEELARRSPLLSRFPVVRIPNGLDGDVFRPINRFHARLALGLPKNALVILFCAHILDDNPRKGGNYLIQALNLLGAQHNLVLALLGQGGQSWEGQVPCKIHRLGFQSDAKYIANCYAASDVVVIPSVLENLPNTLIEALACGRPVVAFDCGGMRDGVLHGETGYLASSKDIEDFVRGLQTLLGNKELRIEMEHKSRKLFEHEFTCEREVERFEKLYRVLLTTGKSPN